MPEIVKFPRKQSQKESKPTNGEGEQDPFGPNRDGYDSDNHDPFGETAPELTDEELKEFNKTELERYRLRQKNFPAPMNEAAFNGVAGDVVRIIKAVSEACQEAILSQFIVACGSLIGRGPHRKQAGIHHLNEYTVLVGETARGRKGTSWVPIDNLLWTISPEWSERIKDGYQSGEAVVHAVRDPHYALIPINKRKAGQADKAEQTLIDQGVEDKRLLIVEEEFGRLLAVAGRAGNILSSTLRKAWDGKQWLYTEGKISPEKATGAHVSMIGHSTVSELLELLKEVENKNGFSNRVLWIAVRSKRDHPIPPWINWEAHPQITSHLLKVMDTFGPHAPDRELDWSKAAEKEWGEFYRSISDRTGIVGSIIARSDAHVLRLAMLYTVLDNSTLIDVVHLRAAIAFWKYCERSAVWVFGEKTGSKHADQIQWALDREPKGLTRTEIQLNVFNNHIPKSTLDMAFSALVEAGLATFVSEQPCGRGRKPTERWFSTRHVDNKFAK